jgi:hypothetical protein
MDCLIDTSLLLEADIHQTLQRKSLVINKCLSLRPKLWHKILFEAHIYFDFISKDISKEIKNVDKKL